MTVYILFEKKRAIFIVTLCLYIQYVLCLYLVYDISTQNVKKLYKHNIYINIF